jgi:hypothetical protein
LDISVVKKSQSRIGGITQKAETRALVKAVWTGTNWNDDMVPPANDIWNDAAFQIPGTVEPSSLRLLTDRHPDWQYICADRDVGALRVVPHPHIAFLTPSLPVAGMVESDLKASMSDTWGKAYIDPYKGCRVQFFRRDTVKTGTTLWGRGIFLPAPGESPVGGVDIALWDGNGWGSYVPLMVADTRIPAGLYRGQNGLAFSGDASLSLACDRRLPKDSPVFFLAPLPPWTSTDSPLELDVKCRPGAASGPAYTVEKFAANGYDVVFELQGHQGERFRVAVRRDSRPGRLLTHLPYNGYAIVGVLAPHLACHRWWINLDANGMLVSSTMTTTLSSLVVKGGSLFQFDWSDASWKRNAPQYSLAHIVAGNSARQVLRSREPLGYLSGDVVWHAVGYDWPAGGRAGPSLDWLDFAGAVEGRLEAPREGLAAVENETAGQSSASGVLQQVESTRLWSFGKRKAPQGEFVLGPLLLRRI